MFDYFSHIPILRNSYTMGCPPVRADNPRALASELSYVQVDKHGITYLYHPHQCRPCTSRDISCLSRQRWYKFSDRTVRYSIIVAGDVTVVDIYSQ